MNVRLLRLEIHYQNNLYILNVCTLSGYVWNLSKQFDDSIFDRANDIRSSYLLTLVTLTCIKFLGFVISSFTTMRPLILLLVAFAFVEASSKRFRVQIIVEHPRNLSLAKCSKIKPKFMDGRIFCLLETFHNRIYPKLQRKLTFAFHFTFVPVN